MNHFSHLKVLSGINIVLFALFFYLEDPFSFRVKSYEEAEPLLPFSDIIKIKIQKEELSPFTVELLDLDKEESRGILNQRWNFPVDSSKKNNLLSAILNSRKFTLLGKDKEQLQDLGPVEYRLRFESSSNQTVEWELFEGIARGGKTYIRILGESEIWLVPDNLRLLLGRGYSEHFVRTKISPDSLDPNSIIKIELVGKGSYLLQKQGDTWFQQSPNKKKLSRDVIARIFQRLKFLDASRLVLDQNLPSLNSQFQHKFQFFWKSPTNQLIGSVEIQCLGKSKDNGYYYENLKDGSIFRLEEYQVEDLLKPRLEEE